MADSSPKLILFCGPSGSGKTTIVKYLLDNVPGLAFSVSATTRKIRANEVDGKDYYFLSIDDFRKKIENNEFLEWEQVYENGYYGTLKSEIIRISLNGKTAVFDIDVEGGMNIKRQFTDNLLDVFVSPPNEEELRKRLIARATETPETLEARVKKASHELTYSNRFSHLIINKNIEEAFEKALQLVQAFLAK
jgi:guanylate kinase